MTQRQIWHIVFWPVLAATLAVYLAMVLWSLPFIQTEAGGLRPFDLRPCGYSPDEARAFLNALGKSGRSFYLGTQHRLDLFFPGLLAVLMILGLSRLYSRRWTVALGLIAVSAAFCDYEENIAVADLLRLGPTGIDEEVVSIASLFTMLKSLLSTVVFVALLWGVVRIWMRRRGKAKA